MPFVTTLVGFVVFAIVMSVFVLQEFTQGFGTPAQSTVRDDRFALWYLEALPVVLVATAVALSFAGWGAWPASRLVWAIGLCLLAVGVAVRQWSHQTLGRFHQATVTIQHDHQLVTGGPYRLVRHPMYAGSAIAFLGVGAALGTWPALAVSFGGTLPAMLRRISVEERAMATALGPSYRTYASSRARLVPGIW